MNSQQTTFGGASFAIGIYVPAGEDRFKTPDHFGGGSRVACKVSANDTSRELYIFESITNGLENVPRHFHRNQDEWFYVIEGEFKFEVGNEKYTLTEGDSLLAPRGVPHVWACVSNSGKLIIACQPAGSMEAFFHEVSDLVASQASDDHFTACYAKHGMQIVGPPLSR